MKYKEAAAAIKNKLQHLYNNNELHQIAEMLLMDITGLTKIARILDEKNEISSAQITNLDNKIDLLLQNMPIQYVLEEAFFYKNKFKVNASCLIPRPETEEMVESILLEIKPIKTPIHIIDIGTGSGCIIISLAKNAPQHNYTAIDISTKAIEIATHNANYHSVKIDFLTLDILQNDININLPKFDYIISNPPYIPIQEKSKMDIKITHFEPPIALFTPDDNVTIFYKKIVQFAENNLHKSGKIWVEINQYLGKETEQIFNQSGYFTQLKKDIFNNDRFIKAYKC